MRGACIYPVNPHSYTSRWSSGKTFSTRNWRHHEHLFELRTCIVHACTFKQAVHRQDLLEKELQHLLHRQDLFQKELKSTNLEEPFWASSMPESSVRIGKAAMLTISHMCAMVFWPPPYVAQECFGPQKLAWKSHLMELCSYQQSIRKLSNEADALLESYGRESRISPTGWRSAANVGHEGRKRYATILNYGRKLVVLYYCSTARYPRAQLILSCIDVSHCFASSPW